MRRLATLCFAMIAIASPGAAQATIDEGSFMLYVNGARVGREQFSIKRSAPAAGAGILARATITLGGRRMESTLHADSAGQLIEYLLEEYAGSSRVNRVSITGSGGRFSARTVNQSGQSEKEIRLTPGTVVSDGDMVSLMYFVGRGPEAGAIPVLSPRGLGRDVVKVSVRSERQDVEVGNGKVPSRHLIVIDAAGTATDIWLDSQGRLLRVAVPSRGFVAVRDEPPA